MLWDSNAPPGIPLMEGWFLIPVAKGSSNIWNNKVVSSLRGSVDYADWADNSSPSPFLWNYRDHNKIPGPKIIVFLIFLKGNLPAYTN